MSINLIINIKDPSISWKKFCKITPKFSIALDGYVNMAPCFDAEGPRINFNHHEQVDRLATRSTCAQVLIAIRQGLFDLFQDNNEPQGNVYVNDCDEDVCLSWFLLKNYRLVENECPEHITRLVTMEDLMDATAGAYPLPVDLSTLKELAWIFEPYRNFRINGGLDRKNINEYQHIINEVLVRIEGYINGKSGHTSLDISYKIIGGGENWTMFEEIGSHARTGAYADGIRAYVSARKISSERWVYTVGKMSPYINFNIARVMKALNMAEGNKKDRWGGATTIGGSPRVNGSKLSPNEIEVIINSVIDQ
ncbi:MAG: hypothetical protein A2Y03_01745 [Omnitrophica WOR_2 bacterium GWF2_38_59]|nr:MAG: hypothetical protein A2Y06_04100 [Omnitrophica WOR_2 bacterium GWA2_37_7]OGX25765.1 MAG: hypothetical protein A2Y03_01745 [Omnitrophica WOR_2 bacterium GWF2_38_59]OGX55090.1 MAG: hypothetical protein A2447_02845 [Omnitrophica WOR_2 bacterium RIFOXYC2_FULL_38_12]HBG61738.1 hypothetical protein [Candidatus Omnitrophota bacterium]